MKFALLSHSLPPSSSGQAVIMQRLLHDFKSNDYCLISPERHSDAGPLERLPAKYYYLPTPFTINRGNRFGLVHLREGMNILFAIWQYARFLTDILRRERCEAIVGCTGDVTFLPAAYLASRRAGVPFYAFVLDHYSYREWNNRANSFWARRLERLLMKRADRVIVLNEMLRDDLQTRFQIDATVIHSPVDITPYEQARQGQTPGAKSEDGEIRIVYTGDVYEAHYDAFRNLMTALDSLHRRDVRLHLYTNRTPEELAALGISGPLVCHPLLAASEMPRVQTEADILFMPLAFNSPYPQLVRTSATTKLCEYLATRRPVLVHAPRDSFVSWYFRTNECGVVVDENDPARLAEGIELILRDAELCSRLTANAFECARTDFSIAASREAFARLVGMNGGRPETLSGSSEGNGPR